MEDDESWLLLDIDDSDLPSLLRPCKRRHHAAAASAAVPSQSQSTSLTLTSHSQSHAATSSSSPLSAHLIPGPAGTLQAAMNRKCRPFSDRPGEESISTQEYLRKAVEDGDHDFSQNPWLCAIDFLRQEGFVDRHGLLLTMPLRLIGDGRSIDRVPQVVAIIKSCTSNGLGDMMVTLKDPTGTVGASIHRRVLTDKDYGKEISVGAVLVLKQVAIFSPSRSAHYLNITLSNVVKVISKVCEPPVEQNNIASSVKHTAFATESSETSSMPQKVLARLQGRTRDNANNLRKDDDVECRAQNDEHMRKDDASGQNRCVNEHAVLEGLNIVVSGDRAAKNHSNEEQEVLLDKYKQQNFGSQAEQGCRTENANINGVQKQTQPPIATARASLPQWTDEQLEELFTFD